MSKKVSAVLMMLLVSAAMFAQVFTGGVKGTVVSRSGRTPIPAAALTLSQNGETIAVASSASDGSFLVENLANGVYAMTVIADGYADVNVNVTVDGGFVKDLIFVSMVPMRTINDVDDSSFAEFDMDDSGYTDNPTILFGSVDPYTNVAGYGFSSIRFKNRGYNSETQDVYLAGVKLNDALTGYSPYSLWSGLNEATRSKESVIGSETSDYGVGGVNGQTNILGTPSSVRPGWRFSVLSNSALYRLRLMANYASGQLDNGWSYAFNVSARLGGNDWVEGVYYKNFSYYAGVEKAFGDMHRLALVSFAAPGSRGAQNSSTQEVYDLMGDNMYNSNWGYQNGKVRNSRVRKTFEPVTFLKYTFTPSDKVEANATLLWRTGFNGYTALDWYDAQDPRPDYYRNLPSYYFMEDEDYNRFNEEKWDWSKYQWETHTPQFANYQHLNWDRLYNVNYNNPDGRSKYALEERRVDQNDVNLALSAKWRQSDLFTLTGGVNGRWNRTENYKILNDLLGGQYYLNVDSFAERDFAKDEEKIQNDLDYYLAHGEAQKILKGQKYGYDYLAQIRKAEAWATAQITRGGFTLIAAGTAGYESFWREGLVRKGLFPEDSFGKSKKSNFFTYSAKLHAAYVLKGGHRFSVNAAYLNDAPTFNGSFVSARTRNTLVSDINSGFTTKKTMSFDANYQLSTTWMQLRVTGFYAKILDQSDVMSFYDDSQNSFTNFAMTGIAERHAGVELGVKVPLPVQGLSVSGVLSFGEYVYTKNRGKNPFMVQTIDNSAELVRAEEVPYWVSHPIYKTMSDEAGNIVYVDDPVTGELVALKEQKHYVPSSPQLAAELAVNYRTNSYWFFELNGQYFAKSYLDMNPLYRTTFATSGPDGIESPAEIEYMASQEKFNPAFLLNASVGKSWYIKRTYNFGFSLEVKNMLNNRNVKTGGYEQTRVIKSSKTDRYYKFDPKYFYMQGANYMLNLYFRF